ncbi:hypothetical protein Goari_011420 [Gossypium aridum]|uniref:Uncharacterized protein n=1 Tax=Gossypium aridum TaxID=34290 RepID=A0A7J8WXH5_GOSAI|nr:hypothetical protein [Gossypium aridum]
MHEIDRVLRQLRFQKSIPVALQDLDDLHPIDLQQSYENWSDPWQAIFVWGRGEESASPKRAPTESPLVIPSMYGTQHSYAYSSFVTQTPLGSLFYQGGSSSQPPIPRPEDAQW